MSNAISSLPAPPLPPRLWPRLRAGLRAFTESLSPRRCAGCEGPLPVSDRPLIAFCPTCVVALSPALDGRCGRCGAVDDTDTPRRPGGRCRSCRLLPPPYRRAVAFWRYGGPLRDAIVTWKDRPALHLSAPLGDLYLRGLVDLFGIDLPAVDLIVPVPPSPGRIKGRGFNPPAMLADRLTGFLRDHGGRAELSLRALRFRPGAAATHRNAPRQVRLRRSSLAFEADRRAVEGRRVWLVDDVLTTGATVAGAAAALLGAGALSVDVGVLARVPGPRAPVPQPPGPSSHEKAARSACTPSSFRKSQSC